MMRKLTVGGTMRSRQLLLRRYICYLLILTVTIYIIFQIQYYNNNKEPPIPVTPGYNQYMDKNGGYLQRSGYKILQFVTIPILQTFSELYLHLDAQNELKLYFQLVPQRSYHVTLIDLKYEQEPIVVKRKRNQKVQQVRQNPFKVLKEEQELLDTNGTYTTCQGKQMIIMEKNEIRMQVELPSDYINNILKNLQDRWKQKFLQLISLQYSSFYITLAYQFKDIPNREIFNLIDKGLKEWQQWPVDIELDPIEICSYTDIITYTPIVPDEIADT